MTHKLIAIVVAIAINCAVLAWFHAWSSAAIANAAAAAHTPASVTLPVINVHPPTELLDALRHARAAPPQTRSAAAPPSVAMRGA